VTRSTLCNILAASPGRMGEFGSLESNQFEGAGVVLEGQLARIITPSWRRSSRSRKTGTNLPGSTATRAFSPDARGLRRENAARCGSHRGSAMGKICRRPDFSRAFGMKTLPSKVDRIGVRQIQRLLAARTGSHFYSSFSRGIFL